MVEKIKNFFGGMIGVVLFLCLAGMSTYKGRDALRLVFGGRQTEARITIMKASRDARKANSSVSYYIYYAGEVEGRDFSGWSSVGKSDYDEHHFEGPVEVTYLPSEPNVNAFGHASNMRWNLALCGGFTLLFGGFAYISALYAFGRI